jgi:hypothetical protein
MATKRISLLTAAALAATLVLAVAALPAQAALRHMDATVLSKNAENRTFRVSAENGNRLRIKVGPSTEFERIPGGFSGLHRGLRVEIEARHVANGLIAVQVEPQGGDGGGGSGGDGSGGGGDDGPNHT